MLDVKKLLAKILLRLNNYTKVVETQTFTHLGKFWTFRRIGNIVFVDAPNDMSGTVAAGSTNIGTLNASLRPGYNVYLKCTNQNASVDQSPVVVLQCIRECLPRLLQGAKSWQSCSCLGRILKWLDNHARCLSCVDNIITTIQTIAERQICMWRTWWNARDNGLRRYEWGCVSIYNSNHRILEFYSNLLCEIISEKGCLVC